MKTKMRACLDPLKVTTATDLLAFAAARKSLALELTGQTASPNARVDELLYGAQAASDVYSPVSGEVVEFNEKLVEEPGTVRL